MSLARISRGVGAVALLAIGALVLHQARYMLAFGGGAGAELERTGHGYLELLLPLLVALAAAGLIVSVVGPALLRHAPGRDREWGATERAAGYAAALVAVHLTQETAEGLLAAGHSLSLEAVLGTGGFVVLPLAMTLGAIASLVRGSLRRAERRLAVALDRARLPRPPRRAGAPRRAAVRATLSSQVMPLGRASRPPPLGALA